MSQNDISPWSNEEDFGINPRLTYINSLRNIHNITNHSQGKAHLSQNAKSRSKTTPKPLPNKTKHNPEEQNKTTEGAKICFLNSLIYEGTPSTAIVSGKSVTKVGFRVKKKSINQLSKMRKQIYYNLAELNYSNNENTRKNKLKKLQITEKSARKQKSKKNRISKCKWSQYYLMRKLHITENDKSVYEEQFSDRKIHIINKENVKEPVETSIKGAKSISNIRFVELFCEVPSQMSKLKAKKQITPHRFKNNQ